MAAAGWAADGDLPAVHMTHRAMGAEFDFVLVGDSPQTSPDALTYAGEAAFASFAASSTSALPAA